MNNRIWVAAVAAVAALVIAMPATAVAGKGERKAAAENAQLLDKLDTQLENLQAAVTALAPLDTGVPAADTIRETRRTIDRLEDILGISRP